MRKFCYVKSKRKLMFNEDDYKNLSKVLQGIQSDITNIWEDHYSQIQNLSEEEMYKAEYITAETERQLAAKQKEYDLAQLIPEREDTIGG